MTASVPAPVSSSHDCPDAGCAGVEAQTLSARMLLRLLSLYQATSVIRRPSCRYIPTCSQYAVEAVSLHGAPRGSWLAVRRLSRCQPFGSFGFDPVPGSE